MLPPRNGAFRWRLADQPSTPRFQLRIVPFRSLDSQRSRSRKTVDIGISARPLVPRERSTLCERATC